MKPTLITSIMLALTGLALALAGQPALAHEGHHSGGAASGLWHLLTQPDHWLLLFALAAPVVLSYALVWLRARVKSTAARSVR